MSRETQVPPGPTVVKLGGSLLGREELGPWLTAIATAPGPPRIVVPGGGPFADAVRAAQARLGFHDLAAHRMAILAMQQQGLLLQALEPRLGLAETPAELARLGGGAAVWLPWRMVGRDRSVEASWDLTSDSLALILAGRVGAPRLLLVKSARPPEDGRCGARRLAEAGVVDPTFPALAQAYPGEIRYAWRGDTAEAGRMLADLECALPLVTAE